MKEIDIIKHARSYMAQLSEMINPITKVKYSDNSDMNNERLLKCFAFVTEILDRVILEEENNNKEINNSNNNNGGESSHSDVNNSENNSEKTDSESSFFKNTLVPEDVEGDEVVKTLIKKGVLKIGLSSDETVVKK